jgi:hypothetical protein
VVEGVAHHVDQRIGERFDHAFVDPDIAAFEHQVDRFPVLLREIANHPRQPVENRVHRHHPQLERRLMQAAKHAGEQFLAEGLEYREEFAALLARQTLAKAAGAGKQRPRVDSADDMAEGPDQHSQLAQFVEKGVERLAADPDQIDDGAPRRRSPVARRRRRRRLVEHRLATRVRSQPPDALDALPLGVEGQERRGQLGWLER